MKIFKYFLIFPFSDFAVKYVTVEDCSHVLFHGHEAPILSVALDPEEEFVVYMYLNS